MLAQHFVSGPDTFAPFGRDVEDVGEVGIECELADRNLFRQAEMIELTDG